MRRQKECGRVLTYWHDPSMVMIMMCPNSEHGHSRPGEFLLTT